MTNSEQVRLLLPWYVNGTLEVPEKNMVDEALAKSSQLQKDLEEQTIIHRLVHDDEAMLDISVVNTLDQRMGDVLERIDVYEASRAKHRQMIEESNKARHSLVNRVKSWISPLWDIAPMRYASAALVALFVVQTAVFVTSDVGDQPETGMNVVVAEPQAFADYKLSSIDDYQVPLTVEAADAHDAQLAAGKTNIYIKFTQETTKSEARAILSDYERISGFKLLNYLEANETYILQPTENLSKAAVKDQLNILRNMSSVSLAVEGLREEGNKQ